MKHKSKTAVIVLLAAACAVAAAVFIHLSGRGQSGSVYDQLHSQGYSGTQEELLASLAGENTKMFDFEGPETAYLLARAKGYSESYPKWVKTVTGAESNTDRQTESMYLLACAAGYNGSLAHWLDSLVSDPSALGRGSDGTKSGYELACDYGFSGSFSEWLVSLIN